MGKSVERLVFRTHAIQRMFERGVSTDDIRHVLATGETIEDYPDDQPFPSRLVLGWRGQRPLHIIVADNSAKNQIIVITVYEPDPKLWKPGFKRRKS